MDQDGNVIDILVQPRRDHIIVDITSIANSNAGIPLRLRFAEADNVFTFQLGVDNVDIIVGQAGVPEPSTWLAAAALAVIRAIRLRTRVA